MLPPERDLFGKRIKIRRSRYEVGLQKYDVATRTDRAERLRWVDKTIPRGISIGGPYETMLVFAEAKDCYIAGQPIAALVLAAAFIEHWLSGFIAAKGFEVESRKGLAACTELARRQDYLPTAVLKKLDRLRVVRNPFVHLKPFDHEHIISRRMLAARVAPDQLMDQDARDAISLMYTIGLYAK
jgi:hypothetical protein